MTIVRMILAGVLVALLAACSSVPTAQREHDRQAAYAAAAGEPVRSFRFFTLYSWEPLGDSRLAVYTRPREAWLLDLGGSCPDLPYANVIALTSSLHQVSVHFDKVLTPRRDFPCTISRIRPVDLARLKTVQQAQRVIESQPRPAVVH